MQFSWVDAVTTWPTLKSVEFALFLSFLEIIRITDHTFSFVIIFLGPEGAPVCSMQDSECVRNSQSTQGKIIGDTGNPMQRNATQRNATQRDSRPPADGQVKNDKKSHPLSVLFQSRHFHLGSDLGAKWADIRFQNIYRETFNFSNKSCYRGDKGQNLVRKHVHV